MNRNEKFQVASIVKDKDMENFIVDVNVKKDAYAIVKVSLWMNAGSDTYYADTDTSPQFGSVLEQLKSL